MKSCDLNAGAAKLELALKSFRTTLGAVEQRWNDETERKFRELYLASIEPRVRNMFEAIERLNQALAAAEHDCGDE
jgi:uncharacterized protein YukE